MTTTAATELPALTYQLAQRLQAIASDSLHSFTAGTRHLDRPDLAALGDFTLTGTYTNDDGVLTATVWARDTATHTLQAAAQARADTTTASPAAFISSRILHFRSGSLAWSGTPEGEPIAYTALGAYPYRLEPVYRIDGPPNWILTATGLDRQLSQFAGIYSACTHIAATLEEAVPAPPRRTRRR